MASLGSPKPAKDLAKACQQLLEGTQRQLDSAALRDALLDLHEFWLNSKAAELGISADSGLAIVAVGRLVPASVSISYGVLSLVATLAARIAYRRWRERKHRPDRNTAERTSAVVSGVPRCR